MTKKAIIASLVVDEKAKIALACYMTPEKPYSLQSIREMIQRLCGYLPTEESALAVLFNLQDSGTINRRGNDWYMPKGKQVLAGEQDGH